jgi:sulfate adenylyltransferase
MIMDRLNTPSRACIWLTGLSGAGKSTTATALAERLTTLGYRVALLDGDAVRARFSPRLGFTRHDREINVLRVARMAREAVDNGEIAICALISPYRDSRMHARDIVGAAAFIEVFIDAPLAVCEARDVKGLYRRARVGEITGVTGIDDPYEPPTAPDVKLLTAESTLEANLAVLLTVLANRGVIRRALAEPGSATETDFSRPS